MIFCCMSNDLKCLPINFTYLLCLTCLNGIFQVALKAIFGHQAILRRGNVFYDVYKRFFVTFLRFYVYLIFIWTFFSSMVVRTPATFTFCSQHIDWPGTRFTKYLTTILRLSYDNAKVTIDLRRTTNLPSYEWSKAFLRYDSLERSSETVFVN